MVMPITSINESVVANLHAAQDRNGLMLTAVRNTVKAFQELPSIRTTINFANDQDTSSAVEQVVIGVGSLVNVVG